MEARKQERSTAMTDRLQAVLLDVGGTLWPQNGPAAPNADALRVERICAALPGLGDERGAELLRAMESHWTDFDNSGALAQDRDALVHRAAGVSMSRSTPRRSSRCAGPSACPRRNL